MRNLLILYKLDIRFLSFSYDFGRMTPMLARLTKMTLKLTVSVCHNLRHWSCDRRVGADTSKFIRHFEPDPSNVNVFQRKFE